MLLFYSTFKEDVLDQQTLKWVWQCGGCGEEHTETSDKAPRFCSKCKREVSDISSLIALAQDTGLRIPAPLETPGGIRLIECRGCGQVCLREERSCHACGIPL